MLQLWLYHKNSLYDNLFDFVPYLLSILPVSLSIWLADHFTSQHIFQPQLMFCAIKLCIVLVKWIVCQMNERIIKALRWIIFFSCQSHEAVVIQEYGHRTYNWGNQYIYTKVVFVPIIKCRPLDVFLDDVLVLRLFNLTRQEGIPLLLGRRMRICLHRVNTLFDFQIFVHLLPVLLVCLIKLDTHLFNLSCNKNTSTLWSRFGLTNIEDNRILLRLSLGHSSLVDFLFALLGLFLLILLDVMKLSWVHPRLWKEIIMIWKLLLKTLEMHTESTFSTNVVHAQIVINSLSVG